MVSSDETPKISASGKWYNLDKVDLSKGNIECK